jgi:hypothetical protein
MAILFRHSSQTATRSPARARLALEPLEERAVPATFTVTNLNNSGPGSLRQALADADAPGADTIVFQPGLSGTITLAGQLNVNDSVTITGPGAGVLTISGNNNSRIFEIDNGTNASIDVTISGLTLTRGNAGALDGGAIHVANEALTLRGMVITGNTAGGVIRGGGGVFIDLNGRLRLEDSTVSNNIAMTDGGGLYLNDFSTTVVLRSTISGNHSGAPGIGGGGVFVGGGAFLSAEDTTISNNQTPLSGGGVCVFGGGSLVLRRSTVSGNSAGTGGGVLISGSPLVEVENSTISGNTARFDGGAIWMSKATAATIVNSTIAFNVADSDNNGTGDGGGIKLFADMPANSLTLQSTIVAQNTRGTAGTRDDINGTVEGTSENNLIGVDTGLLGIAGAIKGNLIGTAASPIDPRLGPLQFNGGHTLTHALLPGSPAIDHGANIVGLTSDQRGFPFLRSSGPGVDIGAFEVQPNPGPTAQAIQAAVQAIHALQPAGVHLAAFTFGDVNGDFVNDIVLALRLRNHKLLIATFDGIDGHIRAVFQPFTAPLRTEAKVRLMLVDVSADPGAEIVLLINGGGPGVPRLSVFTEMGIRVL